MKIEEIILETETLINIFLLLLILGKAYGYKKNLNHYLLIILTLLWTLLYEPFYHLFGLLIINSYLMHIFVLLFCCCSYIFLFLDEDNHKNALSILSVFICVMNSLKGIISILFEIIPLLSSFEGYAKQLCFDLIYLPLIFLCILFFQKHPLKTPAKLSFRYWGIIIGLPAFMLVSTQLMIVYNFSGQKTANLIFFISFFIISIAVYYLSYILVDTYETLQATTSVNQRLELQLDNVERSSAMVEQIRRDKHEMKNVYFYITSLCNSGEYDELKNFANTKLLHRYDIYEEFNTGNTLIDFLLTQKVSEAREYSIHVITNILIPPSLSIEQNDLCGLLLNLIDNAIDASKKEEKGDIHISIKVIKNYLIIKIKNKSSIDVLAKNPKLRTTKNTLQNHGIGLNVVRAIVKKYNGMFNAYMESGYFVVDIMLACSPALNSSDS